MPSGPPYRLPAMKPLTTAVVISLVILCASCAVWAIAAPLFAPEPGVLVLKNGRVIEGGILREGDRYLVTVGDENSSGELKIPVADVLFACRDLVEAYERKRDLIRTLDTTPHVELAQWCITQGLLDRAADELLTAMKIDPSDRKIAEAERRLKAAATPKGAKPLPVYSLPPTQEDIAASVRTLSPEAIAQFTSTVQPILLSRCAATACHGPSSASEYHLVRPPTRHVNTTRETQRNLFATLAQVKVDGESPLLTVPLAPHGSMKSAVLDQQDRRQIEQLSEWIEMVKRSSAPAEKTTSSKEKYPVQPADFTEPVKGGGPTTRRLPAVEPQPLPANQGAKAMQKPGAKKPVADIDSASFARDPFDANIFNERYHGGKQDQK